MKSISKLIGFIILSATLLFAQTNNVSIHQLDNGLQVLLIQNPALPMVGVNVIVKVGSAYETFATSGMSHMLEHLLFNGTTSRTQKQLYDDVDRIGGYNNANTGQYYTNYMMVVPAENIKQGLEIQSDMLFHSILPEEKFEKEKGIVLEEISKTLADPDAQAERNVMAVLFKGHAFSLPTLGTYATIQHMDREAVFDFYKNYYTPNNMIMSVIGNFDPQQILKWINEYYGKEAPGLVEYPRMSQWSTGFEKMHLQSPAPGSRFQRTYGGKKPLVQLFFPLKNSYNDVFFDLMEEKFSDLSVEMKKALGSNVERVELHTYPNPLQNYLEVSLTLKSDLNQKDTLIEHALSILKNADFSLSREEAETYANKALTFFYKNLEKPHMFGIYYASSLAAGGFEAILKKSETQRFLKAADDLKAFALNMKPIIIEQKPLTQAARSDSAKAISIKQFDLGPEGPTLIVKQNPANKLIAIHYLFKHKAFFQEKYGKKAAQILHDCFGQRMKAPQNLKMSNRFGLSFTVNDNPYIPMDDIYLHPDFGYIRVEGLGNDVPALIAYLNQQMKNFVPTQKEFQKAMAKQAMNMRRGNPAQKTFNHLVNKTVYAPSLYAEGPEDLTYQNILQFAREYFRPANMIISVVSAKPAEEIHQLFLNFKGQPFNQEPAVYDETLNLIDSTVTIEKQGNGERSYIFWGFTKKIQPEDRAALKALALVLGDRIVFEIRERQGMAYHMRAGAEIKGDRALFYVKQGTRPENVDVLLPQYANFFQPQFIADLKKDELQKTLNMYLGRMMFRRLSSINQAYYLGTSLYFHNDAFYDQKFLDALKKVTLSDVQRVAQKYLQVEYPIQIVVR